MSEPTAAPGPRLWPLYLGGFLGPFGGAMVNAILPEVADGLGTTQAGAATALTVYMIPFSALMIVSGTLGARWGTARTIRLAYGLYAVASLVCMVAGALPVFLVGRALQGTANAFTTPLLVALISTLVPADRLARSLGAYASFQAAGQAFAPLLGGLAAEWTYRAAFGASALAALALAALTRGGAGRTADGTQGESGATSGRTASGPAVSSPTDSGRSDAGRTATGRTATGRSDWAALANPRLARASGIAFANQFASSGVMVLSALVAADRFGLSASVRGLVVAAFGVAGFVAGRSLGRLYERYGLFRVGAAALTVGGVSVALIGVAPWAAALVVLVAAAGVAGTGGRVLTNSLALASTPANPGGATSMMMAVQFVGTALVPALLPVYAASPAAACAIAGAVGLGGAALAWSGRRANAHS